MNSYLIKIRPTNQKSIVKFEANDFLVNRESFEFKNIEEAKDSPLAQKLFYLPFVKTVYITQNFIAIEKYNIVEWEEVQEEVKLQIENDLNNGVVVIKKEAASQKKIPVTVYAESTPNPGVQKFVANKKLVVNAVEFKNIEEAKASPLAQQLFQFPFVKEVFMDSNYVSVHKYDVVEWEEVGMEVRELIKKFLENNEKVVHTELLQNTKSEDTLGEAPVQHGVKFEDMDDTSQRIISILEEYVKPAVASDGGNIVFDSYDENTQEVKVILQGACSGCPSSTMTLKNGIETMLKDMIKGKVSHVVAING